MAALEAAAAPSDPAQLTFAWRAREPDFRGSGLGIARVESPYRARLDLFLENGETAAVAALVDHDLRIPPGLSATLVPPPPLLWAALGVVRPGRDARLARATRNPDGHRLDYTLESGLELRFEIGPGPDPATPGHLRRAALLHGGAVREEVTLDRPVSAGRYPGRATYRNRAEYRELVLTLEMVEDADPFPSAIWSPYALRPAP